MGWRRGDGVVDEEGGRKETHGRSLGWEGADWRASVRAEAGANKTCKCLQLSAGIRNLEIRRLQSSNSFKLWRF